MEKLQEIAKELLEKKEVNLIIGYEKGTEYFWMRPLFVDNIQDIEDLTFNAFCNISLS